MNEKKQYLFKMLLLPKNQLILFGLIWVFAQIFYIYSFGIVTGFEAAKYIEQANHLLTNGTYSSNNFLFYSTEIILIAACKQFNISYSFLVLFQILINALSVYCFYKLLLTIIRNSLIPFISTLYFLAFIYYHQYNTHLFTESLYFSFSIIYTFFLFTTKSLSYKRQFSLLIFLALLYLTRPTGIFFIPATFVYCVARFYPKNAFKVIAGCSLAGIVLFYILLNISLGSGGEFDFLLPYAQEMIICGVSTITTPHKLTIPLEKNSVSGIVYIATHFPKLFFKLAFWRITYFFGIVRPYYSTTHNLFAALYFYPLYLVIIFNAGKLIKKMKSESLYLFSHLFFITITVMISCDEWHNRFLLSQLPFILLLAAFSLGKLNHSNRLSESI